MTNPAPTGISDAVALAQARQRANLEAIAAGTMSRYGPLDGQLPHPPEISDTDRARLELLLAALIAAAGPLQAIDRTYDDTYATAHDLAQSVAWALGRNPGPCWSLLPEPATDDGQGAA